MTKYMTAEETAQYLSIPKSSVYVLARDNKIPGHRLGKHWRFVKEEIDKHLLSAPPPQPQNSSKRPVTAYYDYVSVDGLRLRCPYYGDVADLPLRSTRSFFTHDSIPTPCHRTYYRESDMLYEGDSTIGIYTYNEENIK